MWCASGMGWAGANYFPSHTVLVTVLCKGRWGYRSPVPVHPTRPHWQLCADAGCSEAPAVICIDRKCVCAQQCSVAELWAAAYFLYVCVYVLLLGPPLGFQYRLFLIPWEQAITETHPGLHYKSLWMLTAWRKMLNFASLLCILSPMHVFLRKTGDSCGVYNQLRLACVSQLGSAAMLGGL